MIGRSDSLRGGRTRRAGAIAGAVVAAVFAVVAGSAGAQTTPEDYEKCASRLAKAVTDFSKEYLDALTTCETKRLALGSSLTCEGDSQRATNVAGALQELRSKVNKCKREAEKALCPLGARSGDEIFAALATDEGSLPAPLGAINEALFVDDAGPACPRPEGRVSLAAADCANRVAQGAQQVLVDVERCLVDCEVGRIERGGDPCVDPVTGVPAKQKVIDCYGKARRDLEGLVETKCDTAGLQEIGCPYGTETVADLSDTLVGVAAGIAEPTSLGLYHSSCRRPPVPPAPLPTPVARVTLRPSGREVQLPCGQVVDRAFLAGDDQLILEENLSCEAVTTPTDGLVIAAPEVTIDGTDDFSIIGPASSRNRTGAGIRLAPGARKVRIRRIRQIARFGYGILDSGANRELVVQDVNLFRNVIAGISVSSNRVRIERVTADRNTVGFDLGGDGSEIKESIARGSTPAPGIGVRLRGIDLDGDDFSSAVRESEIEGNMVGIVVEGDSARASANSVDDSLDAGIVVTGTRAKIDQNSVKRSGGDALHIGGTGNLVRKNRIEENGGAGVVVEGYANVIRNNTAGARNGRGNLGGGFVVGGELTEMDNNKAEGNHGPGFVVEQPTALVKSNRSRSNGGEGFRIDSAGNLVDSNAAANNGGAEFAIAPGNIDRSGSNRANGATFGFGNAGGTFD